MVNLKDIKVNINVDTTDFIKKLRQLQEIVKMNDVRILKGWTKEEREELEDAKEADNLGNFLHNITGYPEDTNCGYVWDNYHKASSREQISIIEDILDFYTDKAKFAEQKYVLETTTPNSLARTYIKRILRSTYGGIGAADEIETTSDRNEAIALSENSIIKKLGGKYMTFAEPVEEVSDDE